MTLQSFSRIIRFISISVLLGAALAALFTAWCLAAIALWLIQHNTTAAPVMLSPAMPLLSATAPVRLCLPPASTFYPIKKLAALATISAIAYTGIALATTNQVLITPIRLALPAAVESNKEAVEQIYKVESNLRTKAIAKVRKQRTADLSQMTVTQLRKLAKERGLTRISKLRKDELIAALV